MGCQSQRCLQGRRGGGPLLTFVSKHEGSNQRAVIYVEAAGTETQAPACRRRQQLAVLQACHSVNAAGWAGEAGLSHGHTRSSMPLLSDPSFLPSISVLHAGGALSAASARSRRGTTKCDWRSPAVQVQL